MSEIKKCKAEEMGMIPITLWIYHKPLWDDTHVLYAADGEEFWMEPKLDGEDIRSGRIALPKPPRVGPEINGAPMSEQEVLYFANHFNPAEPNNFIFIKECKTLRDKWAKEDNQNHE